MGPMNTKNSKFHNNKVEIWKRKKLVLTEKLHILPIIHCLGGDAFLLLVSDYKCNNQHANLLRCKGEINRRLCICNDKPITYKLLVHNVLFTFKQGYF